MHGSLLVNVFTNYFCLVLIPIGFSVILEDFTKTSLRNAIHLSRGLKWLTSETVLKETFAKAGRNYDVPSQ